MTELDTTTLILSLKTASVATLLAFIGGIAAAWIMAHREFRGKTALDALFLSPLVLPPTVVGFLLLLAIGTASPLGRAAEALLGESLLFTWPAAVLAATIVSFPLMYRTTRGAFEQTDRSALAAGRSLGAGRWRIFRELGIPLAWPGIVAATVLTFARALGEFGATLMIAGNLPGRTQTIPLAIYTDVESGDIAHAGFWVGTIMLLTLVLTLAAGRLSLRLPRRKRRLPERPPAVEDGGKPVAVRAGALPALSFTLKKRLGSFSLDMSFVATAKSCAIVGASGAGKSVLLRCLSGLERPDLGHVSLNGRVVFDGERGIDLAPAARRVGHVFQNYALFPHMTVFDNILFGLRRLPRLEAQARVWRLIAAADLDDAAAKFPRELSGGQQQRVAIVRALATEPELLVLDEPLSALDTHVRYRLERLLAEAVRDFRGVTLLVTHNLEEAFRICDTLVVLDEGRIIAAGEKHAVFAQPGNVRAAILTGCKNISPIRPGRVSGTVIADAWGGIELALPDDRVLVGPTHIGVRAHQIVVTGTPQQSGDAHNAVPCWLDDVRESPHRMTVHLRLGAAGASPSGAHLQVELQKDAWNTLATMPEPWTAVLRPERLMLLQDGINPCEA